MRIPFFQKKKEVVRTPITKVSLKYAVEKEEIHEELCRLAWQMTIGNAKYADARDVIQEGKAFAIPRDELSQLPVRDIRVHKHGNKVDYYFPDDLEGTPSSATVNGKILGCIFTDEDGVTELADRDDAHVFVECLEKLYKMYADVESGKKLPDEEPKEEDKKKSKSDKDDSKDGKSETKKDADQEDKEETKSTGFPKCPLRDLYAELTDDEVLAKLKDKPRTDRNDFFADLKAEYDFAVEELQKYLQEFVDDLDYYSILVDDLNGGTASPARRFIEETKAQRKAEEEQKEEKANPKKKEEKPEFTEEQMRKRKNYIRRQKGKVRSLTRQLEGEDNVDDLLELLDEMDILLDKGDIEGYKDLKNKFDTYMSADQQTNSDQNSSKGGGKGKNGSDKKSSDKPDGNDSSKDDSKAEEENPDSEASSDNGSEGEQQEETSGNTDDGNSDGEYTIADVLLALRLAGYKEVPKPIKMFSKNRKVAASDVNEVLKSCGIDDVVL